MSFHYVLTVHCFGLPCLYIFLRSLLLSALKHFGGLARWLLDVLQCCYFADYSLTVVKSMKCPVSSKSSSLGSRTSHGYHNCETVNHKSAKLQTGHWKDKTLLSLLSTGRHDYYHILLLYEVTWDLNINGHNSADFEATIPTY